MLTSEMLNENSNYFKSIINMLEENGVWIWKDRNVPFKMCNGKFVLDTPIKKSLMISNTTNEFYGKYCIEE